MTLQSYGKKRNEMLQKAAKLYFNTQNSPLLFRHQIFTPYQAKNNDVIVLVQKTKSTDSLPIPDAESRSYIFRQEGDNLFSIANLHYA